MEQPRTDAAHLCRTAATAGDLQHKLVSLLTEQRHGFPTNPLHGDNVGDTRHRDVKWNKPGTERHLHSRANLNVSILEPRMDPKVPHQEMPIPGGVPACP